MRVLVTGGAGFLGHHLARRLREAGHWVRVADNAALPEPPYPYPYDFFDHYLCTDLTQPGAAQGAVTGVDWVFDLAADMGGMGYIEGRDAQIVTHNTLL